MHCLLGLAGGVDHIGVGTPALARTMVNVDQVHRCYRIAYYAGHRCLPSRAETQRGRRYEVTELLHQLLIQDLLVGMNLA